MTIHDTARSATTDPDTSSHLNTTTHLTTMLTRTTAELVRGGHALAAANAFADGLAADDAQAEAAMSAVIDHLASKTTKQLTNICTGAIRELRRRGIAVEPCTEDRIEEAYLEQKFRKPASGGQFQRSGVNQAEAALDPVGPVFDPIDATRDRGALLLENAEPGLNLADVFAQAIEPRAQSTQVFEDKIVGAVGHGASLTAHPPQRKSQLPAFGEAP